MPWKPLPKIAFAIATYPFEPSSSEDLPLELGDELYIIEEGGKDFSWYRGYLVAPPSLLAGLTSVKGRTLEARVFSGIFPRVCVTVREYLENTNHDSKQGDDSASTIRSIHSQIPRTSDDEVEDGEEEKQEEEAEEEAEEDDDECSLGPDDSASQISVLEGSRNGHVRVRKRRKEDSTENLANQKLIEASKQKRDTMTTPVQKHMENANMGKCKPPAPVPMLKIGDDTSTSQSEPLIDEIASCLREWYSTNLHELTLSRRYSELEELSKLQKKLDSARRQMQTNTLTMQELTALRERTVWNLVKGNKMLSNEVIVRDPLKGGRLLTDKDNALQVASLQAQMSLLHKPILPVTEEINHHHLLVELKDFHPITKDKITLFMALYTSAGSEGLVPLTEPYSIQLPSSSSIKTQAASQLRTLFSDLAASDVGDTKPFGTNIYLVIKAQIRQSLPQTVSRDDISKGSLKESQPSENGKPPLKARRSLMFGTKRFGSTRSKQGASMQTNIDDTIGSTASLTESRNSGMENGNTDVKSITSVPKYYKLDVGFAVFELKDFTEICYGMDKVIDLWYPAETDAEVVDHKDMQVERLNELFKSPTGSYTRSQHISHLQLRLQSFVHHDSEDLIKATPTLLHDTICSRKMGFSGVPTRSRSDIYLTISDAHLPLDGMLSHPTRAAIPIEALRETHQVVVNVQVKASDGQPIPECILDASNADPSTSWQSSAVSRGCRWSQILKLSISKEQVMDCHIVMTIGDPSELPIGICYVPLWNEGAFVSDAAHNLLIYPDDGVIGRVMGGKLAYLHLGWNRKTRENRQFWSHDMAVVRIRTDLVSTFFSQDQVLLTVLNWKDQSDEDLVNILGQLRNVPDLELVKFVSEILDALFGILVQRSASDQFEDLIFRSVVDILTIAQSKRFDLTPVINEYTKTKFRFPFAAPCLMRSYLRLITLHSDDGNSRQIRATLKVGKQLLKFILYARKQQIEKEEHIGLNHRYDHIFPREIRKLFSALEEQMRDPTPSSIGTKTLLVQHVYTWLPDILDSFDEEETAALAVSFIDACSHVVGKLVLHKLVFIWNVVKLSRAWHPLVREMIDKETESWLSQYWGHTTMKDEQYREQVRLCVSIVALLDGEYGPRIFTLLHKVLQSFHCISDMPPEKSEKFSLLFPSTYPFPSRLTDNQRDYDECLVELAALKTTFRPETSPTFRSEFGEHLEIVDIAMRIDVIILQERAFPKSWITLHAFYHHSVMEFLEFFTELAPISNLFPLPEESDSFNMDLWKSFLDTLLVVVRSDALALESLPEQRRKAIWKIVGDLREAGARLLSRNWHALGWPADGEDRQKYGLTRLGGYQVQYVPSLVGPIVELCLSVHEGLRMAAVEILRSMIIAEYDLNGEISAIQIEMVQTLNDLFKNKSIADSALQRLFIDQLMDGFRNIRDSEENEIWSICHNLVLAIDELLDLLVAAHTPDQHELLQIMNTLALLDFLRSMENDDIFIEYAQQLANMETKDRHYQEAGLALKLHADLYSWDLDTKLEALKTPRMPAQSAFDRKEEIYLKMIDCFEKGAVWSSAMECYLELAHQYQHTTFNFSKLAKAQHSMARIYESIAKGDGETSRYFHVEFTGLGFPAALKNKAFIYEGFGTERLTGFADRLQKQYRMAKLLDASDNSDLDETEGQYIKIAIVQVQNDLNHPILRRSKVPLSTKEYVLSRKPKFFSMTVRKHNGVDRSHNEVDNVIFESAEPFPNILRRSQIIAEEVVHLSAIETALERVLRKTFELRHLIKRVSESVLGSLKILADAIKSQVDPASKGSITIYRSLLRKDHGDASKDDQPPFAFISALETAMLDFATLLRDNIPLLQDTKHLEYKNNAILFRSTFEPELKIIALMAPAAPSNSESLIGDMEAGVYSLENTPSTQSLTNGHSDADILIHQAMTPQAIEGRRRIEAIPRILNHTRDQGSSQGTSNNGEAPWPSNAPSKYQSPVGLNESRSPSVASTQQTEKLPCHINSNTKAIHRQSWRTGSEETTGPSTEGSTSKTSASRLKEKFFPITAVQVRMTGDERPKADYSTNRSLASNVGSTTGSIRKRLSVFGMSKKAGKVLGVQEVEEEDI